MTKQEDIGNTRWVIADSIQHTRLDSRRSQLALLSTIAYAG